MTKVIYIALGGATGTLLRYWISGAAYKFGGQGFPWGTITVNLLGALLIGLTWGLTERSALSPNIRAMLFIGIFGGFTTFSTFAFESFNLLKDQNFRSVISYVLISNIAGILLVYAGIILSRIVLTAIK